MDTHTLDLLEFDKIRALVAARAACSLGKEAAMSLEPRPTGRDPRPPGADDRDGRGDRVGLAPPSAACTTSGPTSAAPRSGRCSSPRSWPRRSRRSGRSATSTAGWPGSATSSPGWAGSRQGVGEFSGVATAIEGCLDSRGKVLDTASRRLSVLRREIGQVEERIQETLRRMVRSPEMKRILRYPNFTMVGHHYVLPVAKEHRGEIQGSVQRTSASNETVYIEPTAIAEQSAQLSYLRAARPRRSAASSAGSAPRSARWPTRCSETLETMARAGPDPRPGAATASTTGCRPPTSTPRAGSCSAAARHPLLEAIFRKRSRPCATSERPPARGRPSPSPGASPNPGRGRLPRRHSPADERGPSCRSTCTSACGSRSWS